MIEIGMHLVLWYLQLDLPCLLIVSDQRDQHQPIEFQVSNAG